jgi:hypothetical protein
MLTPEDKKQAQKYLNMLAEARDTKTINWVQSKLEDLAKKDKDSELPKRKVYATPQSYLLLLQEQELALKKEYIESMKRDVAEAEIRKADAKKLTPKKVVMRTGAIVGAVSLACLCPWSLILSVPTIAAEFVD